MRALLIRRILGAGLAVAASASLVRWTARPPEASAAPCRDAFGWLPLPAADAPVRASDSVAQRTAYRRARGEPDPLSIEVVGPRRVELPFPERPRFEVRLHNSDPRPFRIQAPAWVSLRARPLDARDRWGAFAPKHKTFSFLQESEWIELPPGDVLVGGRIEDQDSFAVGLDGFEDAPRPGPVRVRLEYGASEQFRYHRAHRGCGPLATSAVLEFEWAPVHLTRHVGDDAVVAAAIDRLAAKEGVATESAPPLRRVADLGVRALPALFAELEKSGGDLHRRAVVLSALHAATGLLDPRRSEARPGPLGSYGPGRAHDDGGPTKDAQRPFVDRWRELSTLVVSE